MSLAHKFVLYTKALTADGSKCLLIYDGYSAHLSIFVLQLFQQNIIVYSLPSHSYAITQPFVQAIFSLFTNELKFATNSPMLSVEQLMECL